MKMAKVLDAKGQKNHVNNLALLYAVTTTCLTPLQTPMDFRRQWNETTRSSGGRLNGHT